MPRKAKVAQTEHAAVLASERDAAPARKAKPDGLRFRRQFAAPDPNADRKRFLADYGGWALGLDGALPPPPVPGTDVVREYREQPDVLEEVAIVAKMYGGGHYYDAATRKKKLVTLVEGQENPALREKCLTWYDAPMYPMFDKAWQNGNQVRNEAVRWLEARRQAHRSRERLVGTGGAESARCGQCGMEAMQLAWSPALAKALCRDCGPDLDFLSPPVGDR